ARKPGARGRGQHVRRGKSASPRRIPGHFGGGSAMTDPSNSLVATRGAIWGERLERRRRRVQQTPAPAVEGSLTRMIGLTLEAVGCQASIGDCCDVIAADGSRVESEVVGFSGDRLYLMPTGDAHGLGPSARVVPRQRAGIVRVGPQLLGRIVDGAAEPLDGLGPLDCQETVRLTGRPINPLARQPICEPL